MEGSPGALDQIIQLLLGQGLPGLIILVQGFAIWKLYVRNQELHDSLYSNGKESVKALEASSSAINRLSDLLLRGRLPE